MSYAIYLRKSRADIELESNGDMETLARHEKSLLEYAKKYHCTISAIYKEIVSGESIASRPEMQKLLAAVEGGAYDGVLVMEVERLARGDTMDQGLVAQTFKNSGTKILTPAKVYDPNNEFDEEYFEFGLFMSRREYKTINRRIQRGRIASVQEGKFIGSQAPFGYRKLKLENKKGYTLEPDSNAEAVRLIYDMYVNKNMGMAAICRELDQLYIKPMKSSNWSRDSIGEILSNPVYAGKIRWSYKKETKKNVNGAIRKTRQYADAYILVDGMHEAVISEELFNEAQAVRKRKLRVPAKLNTVLQNPLSGIVFCGKCGRLMTRLGYSKKNAYDTLKCPDSNCKNISAPIFLIEKKLINSLELWLDRYKIELGKNMPPAKDPISAMQDSFSRILTEIEKTTKQFDSIFDFLEQGLYSKEQFLNRNKSLSDKLSVLEKEKDGLLKQIDQHTKRADMKLTIIPEIETIIKIYLSLQTPAEKNQLLKSVLYKVDYVKHERNTRGNLHKDNFDLILYPILPT